MENSSKKSSKLKGNELEKVAGGAIHKNEAENLYLWYKRNRNEIESCFNEVYGIWYF